MDEFRIVALALAMAFGLSGCVVVISDEGISASDGIHMSDGASSRDRTLASRVRDAYAADPALKDADVTISAKDGVITLRGELVRVADLERAVDLAKRTEGVDKVVSRLKVEVH